MTTLSELGDAVSAVDHQLSVAPHSALLTGRTEGPFADATAWLASVLPGGVRVPERVRVVRFGFAADAPPPAAGDNDARHVRDVRAGDADMGAAIELGRDVADDEIERGADVLVVVVGRSGVAAEVVTAVLADAEPVKVLPRGAGLEPSEWMSRAERVRDGRRSAMAVRHSVDELLAAVGDGDLAAATALLLRSAGRRTPVVLDGFGALAAALLAYDVQTRTGRWYLVADTTGSPGEEIALSRLGQRALLELGVGQEDGTAGLLAATVLRFAAQVANPGAA